MERNLSFKVCRLCLKTEADVSLSSISIKSGEKFKSISDVDVSFTSHFKLFFIVTIQTLKRFRLFSTSMTR